MQFANPQLWPWTLLALLPIAVSLLYRQRYRRQLWAPMKILQLSLAAHRRRLWFERWLLLAVRVLILLLFVLAAAGPLLTTGSLGGGRRCRVLILDDSVSMGIVGAERSAFAALQTHADAFLAQLPPSDDLAVLLSTRPAQPLLEMQSAADTTAVRRRLGGLAPTAAGADWQRVLDEAERQRRRSLRSVASITIVTNCRRAGWREVRAPQDWRRATTRIEVVSVGSPLQANLAVSGLRPIPGPALVGQPIGCLAKIRNDGRQPARDLSAAIVTEQGRQSLRLPDIEAAGSAEVAFSVRFDSPGDHWVELQLPGDALAADDRAACIIEVQQRYDIAQVTAVGAAAEVDYLHLALSSGNTGWSVRREATLTTALATPPDLLILRGDPGLTQADGERLQQSVAAGMGLMLFADDGLSQASYNLALEGVLPAAAGEIMDLPLVGAEVAPAADSILAPLQNLSAGVLQRLKAERWLAVETPGGGARTLMHWRDVARRPLCLERRIGQGRVLLWTLAPTRTWSEWPLLPSFVLAMHAAASGCAVRSAVPQTAGEPLRIPWKSQAALTDLAINRIDGKPTRFHLGDPGSAATDDSGQLRLPAVSDAGVYEIQYHTVDGQLQRRLLAVAAAGVADHGATIGEAELAEIFAGLPLAVRESAAGSAVAESRELWRPALAVVAILLVVESLLALGMSRYR